MADESASYNGMLEKILEGITYIRGKRNKPNFNTILGYLKRLNIDIDMDDLKSAVGDLLTLGVIYDGGKDGESFYVKDMGDIKTDIDHAVNNTVIDINLIDMTTEDIDEVNDTTDVTFVEDIKTTNPVIPPSFYVHLSDKVKTEVESGVKKILDDGFYNSIKKFIKDEVDLALRRKFEECGTYSNKQETKECNDGNNNLLVKALNDNISFLQKELESKDVIIKMLVSERTPIIIDKEDTAIKHTKNTMTEKKFSVDVEDSSNARKSVANGCSTKNEHINTNILNEGKGFSVVTKKKNKNQRSIAIMGDSILKDVDPYELRQKLKSKADRVYRHNFNGATTRAMKHHSIPVMEFDPDLVILHCGTNSLRGPDNEEKIAMDIVNLANSIKTDTNNILVSSIVARRDQLQEKAEKVNEFLCIKCRQCNLPFMKHNNLRSEIHLKPKGQHLNKEGSALLSDNFAAWINNP